MNEAAARRFWREAMLFAVCGLVGVGLLMSATIDGPVTGFFAALESRAMRILLGLVALFVCFRMRLDSLRKFVLPLYATAVFSCLLPHVLGGATKGASRWVELGGFRFQPAELVKILVVLATAEMIERRKALRDSFVRGVLPVIAVPVAGSLALLTQPDIGHAFFVIAIAGMLVLCGGIRLRHVLVLAGTAITAFVFVLQFFGHSRSRMAEFSSGTPGFQIGRGLESFAEGALGGVGIGAGWMKMGWLPEARNDFVLAIVGNELGLVGSVIVLLLFVLFFVAVVQIALGSGTPWRFLVALGLGVTIVLQACINVLGVTFTVPEKGIDLPFLSSGGTNLVFALASVGILLNIARGGTGSSRRRCDEVSDPRA
ncbi:MAG: FtsW/RodA/SpoVE family cell cycle protein [Planctomycetes bacterium]|nr:FtsW/RodA/SpoVE family cell cycle protein [Planctomycetota bacterium]MCB9919016.1 FtsW/RodA/SpoVE family cell cycle protein [Planctomycetota bacterium]